MSSTTSTYFCVLTIRKHLLKMRFERSSGGQEPSRGHKFSILENIVPFRDCTSATLPRFRSVLVGACLPQTLLFTIRKSCPARPTRTNTHWRHRTVKRLAIYSVLSQPNQINQLAFIIVLLETIQRSTLTAVYTILVRNNSPPFKVCQKFPNLLSVNVNFLFQKG